jgi:hypothetical protein
MGLETREFDTVLAHVKQKTVDMGGYVATSYVSGKKPENYNDSGRYASVPLRIPQERMETFLSDARDIATVTYENSGGEDITANYFDTQSRLEIYQTQRDHIKACWITLLPRWRTGYSWSRSFSALPMKSKT